MFKNYTPHTMKIFDGEGKTLLLELPSVGVARCATTTTMVADADGVPLFKTSFGEVEGLPEWEDGTIVIVSLLVRQALPDRVDLASPGELIRNADGQPVGCRGLAVNG